MKNFRELDNNSCLHYQDVRRRNWKYRRPFAMHDVDICSWLLTLWQTQDHKPTIWGWIIPPIQGFAIGLNALQSTEPTSPARLQRQNYSGNARATQRVEIHQTATKIWRWKVGSWHLTVEILRDVAFTIFDYSKIKVKDLDRGKRRFCHQKLDYYHYGCCSLVYHPKSRLNIEHERNHTWSGDKTW